MRGASARTAVAISVGVHVLLAAGVVVLLRKPTDATPASRFETRADVQFEFVKQDEAPPQANIIPDPPPPAPTPPEQIPEMPPTKTESGGLRLPLAFAPPQTLPPELIAIMRKPQPASPIQPVAAVQPKGPAWAASGSPIHGALDANQRIVYVLDASGSMGEWGKFDSARAALIATLKLQPATVRFQVVVYSGTAFTPLKSAPGECRPATAENVERLVDALAALPSPAGRSQHLDGLRAALAFKPDLVVLFTDAEELPPGPVRGVLKQSERRVTLCVAKADAKGVAPPVEVK